jgi:hypothetical protein
MRALHTRRAATCAHACAPHKTGSNLCACVRSTQDGQQPVRMRALHTRRATTCAHACAPHKTGSNLCAQCGTHRPEPAGREVLGSNLSCSPRPHWPRFHFPQFPPRSPFRKMRLSPGSVTIHDPPPCNRRRSRGNLSYSRKRRYSCIRHCIGAWRVIPQCSNSSSIQRSRTGVCDVDRPTVLCIRLRHKIALRVHGHSWHQWGREPWIRLQLRAISLSPWRMVVNGEFRDCLRSCRQMAVEEAPVE